MTEEEEYALDQLENVVERLRTLYASGATMRKDWPAIERIRKEVDEAFTNWWRIVRSDR